MTAAIVKRTGQKLTLGGLPYTFVGLNIYNANSRDNCWYPLGYNDGALAATLTASGTRSFRAWFFQPLATTNGRRDWAAFDHTFAVARAAGVKVIVTLANQWPDCDSGAYRDAEWYRTGYRTTVEGVQTYRDYVASVTCRYRSEPSILAWQLMNEAEGVLKDWATDMAKVVKSNDTRHLLSIGTMGSGQSGADGSNYQSLHDIPEVDLCEFHDYGDLAPMPGDQWNGLALRLQQAKALNKPLFVGEAGIPATDPNRAAKFDAKITTQFAAGAVGFMPWAWNAGASDGDQYVIGPGDPTLALLR